MITTREYHNRALAWQQVFEHALARHLYLQFDHRPHDKLVSMQVSMISLDPEDLTQLLELMDYVIEATKDRS